MKPITDEKLFFSLYYDTDARYSAIEAPRDRGEIVVATDCHILIKVDKKLLKETYKKETKPNLPTVRTNRNCRLTLSQLEKALSKCQLEDEEELVAPAVKCRHCDGEGLVEWQFEDKDYRVHYDTDECPCCNGSGNEREAQYRKTGRRFPEYNQRIDINGVPFSAYYIAVIVETMKQLGISEIYHARIYGGPEPNVFKIAEGIEVILMPILPAVDSVACVNGKEVEK